MNQKEFFKKFVQPHTIFILILLFVSFLGLLFSFINPLLTRLLIDNVFVNRNFDLLFYIIIAFIGLYLLSAASSYFSNYLTGKLQVVILKNVSESALDHIQYASIENTQDFKVGDMITRIIGNTQIVIGVPISIVPQIIMSAISIVVPFIIMIYLNLQLALIVMSPVFFFCLSSFIFGKRMEHMQKIFLEENASIYSFLKEKLSVSNVNRADLIRSISMIFPDPYLFDDSIYENIQIGNLSASKDEIIQAAKLVNIHKFIENLPNGYETQIGESGITLSSGEKQKIALARAILKNSPIILLDEVTKSIDSESRESINKAINNLKKEKTIIIVTHNFNEIEHDSNIVYLQQELNESQIEKTVGCPMNLIT